MKKCCFSVSFMMANWIFWGGSCFSSKTRNLTEKNKQFKDVNLSSAKLWLVLWHSDNTIISSCCPNVYLIQRKLSSAHNSTTRLVPPFIKTGIYSQNVFNSNVLLICVGAFGTAIFYQKKESGHILTHNYNYLSCRCRYLVYLHYNLYLVGTKGV